MPDELADELISRIIWSCEEDVVAEFRRHFEADVGSVVAKLARIGTEISKWESILRPAEPAATVVLFLHTAFNSLVSAVHHLVTGYAVESVHMMRLYTESVAMAMLCGVDETGVFQRYDADRAKYAVHKSPDAIKQRRYSEPLVNALGLKGDGWNSVLEATKFYDKHSHVSAVALGHQLIFTETGGRRVGGAFDPEKTSEYKKILTTVDSAAASLLDLVIALLSRLPRKT